MLARIRGALLGTMLGDALGLPFEGARGDDVRSQAQRRAESTPCLGYSDDTEMMIAIAESILPGRDFDADRAVAALASRHEPARGYGRGMNRFVRAINDGDSMQDAARTTWPDGSRGNGAAVRVAPIACAFAGERLADAAASSARITHTHADAITGAVILAIAIRLRLDGAVPTDVLATVIGLADSSAAWRAKLSWISAHLDDPASSTVSTTLGNDVLALDSVPLALWSGLRGVPVREALLDAVGFGGDADTIGAMTGALLGAAHGVDAFPREWIAKLEEGSSGRSYVERLATHLASAS